MTIAQEILQTPIQQLSSDLYCATGVEVFVKREDLCHPIMSGNKWHKLVFNLRAAEKHTEIASFGGAWSNHLHSLAYACMRLGKPFTALVRGDELAKKPLNAMLSDIKRWGAELHFLSREQYRLKEESIVYKTLFHDKDVYLIPEGANNEEGIAGSEVFAGKVFEQFHQEQNHLPSHVLMSAGTGAMTSGFIKAIQSMPHDQKPEIKSYLALKDKARVETNIQKKVNKGSSKVIWCIDDSYAGKGFAQVNAPLKEFINSFQEQQGFELDSVYTSKMFYGFHQDLCKGLFPQGSCILLIHSGGLQGLRGLSEDSR